MDLYVTETRAGDQRSQIVRAVKADAVSSISDHPLSFAQHHLPGADKTVFYFPLPADDHIIADLVPGMRSDIRTHGFPIGDVQQQPTPRLEEAPTLLQDAQVCIRLRDVA